LLLKGEQGAKTEKGLKKLMRSKTAETPQKKNADKRRGRGGTRGCTRRGCGVLEKGKKSTGRTRSRVRGVGAPQKSRKDLGPGWGVEAGTRLMTGPRRGEPRGRLSQRATTGGGVPGAAQLVVCCRNSRMEGLWKAQIEPEAPAMYLQGVGRNGSSHTRK